MLFSKTRKLFNRPLVCSESDLFLYSSGTKFFFVIYLILSNLLPMLYFFCVAFSLFFNQEGIFYTVFCSVPVFVCFVLRKELFVFFSCDVILYLLS